MKHMALIVRCTSQPCDNHFEIYIHVCVSVYVMVMSALVEQVGQAVSGQFRAEPRPTRLWAQCIRERVSVTSTPGLFAWNTRLIKEWEHNESLCRSVNTQRHN